VFFQISIFSKLIRRRNTDKNKKKFEFSRLLWFILFISLRSLFSFYKIVVFMNAHNNSQNNSCAMFSTDDDTGPSNHVLKVLTNAGVSGDCPPRTRICIKYCKVACSSRIFATLKIESICFCVMIFAHATKTISSRVSFWGVKT
jgi:hypothetical protein